MLLWELFDIEKPVGDDNVYSNRVVSLTIPSPQTFIKVASRELIIDRFGRIFFILMDLKIFQFLPELPEAIKTHES